MKNLGKITSIILFLIINPIIIGFVFSKLWSWFIVPVFQIKPLRIIDAIGIIVIIGFLRVVEEKKLTKDNYWEYFKNKSFRSISLSGMTLLFGWIVSLFI